MDKVAEEANGKGLVIFVGAGISMLPPTSLPSWYELNQMTLTSLANRIGDYIHSPGHAERLKEDLVKRRDRTDCFAPDYQAQLMVEECGDTYFRVLQALDSPVTNVCHEALASLAASGKVKAILTTNFDRLCEQALETRQVPHQIYADLGAFSELRAAVEQEGDLPGIPVIKIHGSVEKVDSMVDTLQQRIQGRGEDLPFILGWLQTRYHWLFIGFSGADFDYDPDYLNLKSSAKDGKGFTFLVRTGEEARRSVQELIAAYDGRATASQGELPDWLSALLVTLNLTGIDASIVQTANPVRLSVQARIDEWSASLEIMQIISIYGALLCGADANIEAYSLLRLVWRHYREMDDSLGVGYGRFCYQFGTRLLEHGVTPDENWEGAYRSTLTVGDPSDWQENAFQFLGRAKKIYGLEEATPNLALALAYEGNLPGAQAGLSESLRYAADQGSSQIWSDGVYAAGIINYLLRNWTAGREILFQSYRTIRWDGDEPRRARFNAWLGAYLAWANAHDLAEQLIQEGLEIAEALGLTATKGDTLWAAAVLEIEKKNGRKSFELLDAAWRIFEENSLRPRLILTYLEAARSIELTTTDADFNIWAVDRFLEMQKVVDNLVEKEQLQGFLPGYSLTNYFYFWNLAVAAGQAGEREVAVDLVLMAAHNLADASRFARVQENKGVLSAAVAEEPDMRAKLQALGLK